jgi:hypothetical protein
MVLFTTNSRRFWPDSGFRDAMQFGAPQPNSSVRIGAAMQTRKEIEQMGVIPLVAQCGNVANDASMDEETRAQAWQLKLEWALLGAESDPPPLSNFKKHCAQREAAEALRNRMVEFLSRLTT